MDHQKALGNNGTGLSLSEFYESYASTEGSNLDGGTIVDPGSKPTTTTAKQETTITTTTTTTTPEQVAGDINLDGTVTLSDMVILSRFLLADTSVSSSSTKWNLSAGDVNQDKKLNGFDLAIYKSHFLTGKAFPE